ncbi:MAG: transposase [Comamonadaceae bacterium]|mgnify:CR=1 FL=1|jgi:hypothetical protein|nr:transposase [Comamonadaceae bacterium]MBN9369422.1 transposase [Comamonadaceae bacterium]
MLRRELRWRHPPAAVVRPYLVVVDLSARNLNARLLQALERDPVGRLRVAMEGVHPIKWRAKFGGMDASDAKRLRDLEAENNRLKKLLAEAVLDNEALKVAFGVKR